MRFLQGRNIRMTLLQRLFITSILSLIWAGALVAQARDSYLTGGNGQLEMIVHIIGEIKKPGEFQVVDTTNLMELISKAAGPTEFSNLGSVSITRSYREVQTNGHSGKNGKNGYSRSLRGKRIIKFNVKQYLETGKIPPPTLKPGDIVLVPRNNWRKWRNAFTIVRDLSVLASAYFLYLRATRD